MPDGITLTIKSGVTVLFGGAYRVQVAGTLIAEGTPSAPVTFRGLAASQEDSAFDITWLGIEFLSGTLVNGRSSISYTVIRNADRGIELETGKNVPNIYHSKIAGNYYGLYAGGPYLSTSMTISNSLVSGNNVGVWLRVSDDGALAIIDSQITGNVIGVDGTYTFGLLQINASNIYSNSMYNMKGANVVIGPDIAIDATGNWWGTTSLPEIHDTVLDYNDDMSLGTINLEPLAPIPFAITDHP